MSPVSLGAAISEALKAKEARLRESLARLLADGLVVAFSGGVDSTYLLWVAEEVRREQGGRLLAVTAVSASLSATERQDVEHIAALLGAEHRWEESRELSNPAYVRNDFDRCYHCKTELFRLSHDLAAAHGLRWIAYGYNHTDRHDLRPGHRAAIERQILAPLHDATLEKEEIRALLRARGLPFAEKPASPCLSSRLMHGVAVTPEKLRDVEACEEILRRGGLKVFRVRLHEHGPDRWMRVEVPPDEMTAVLRVRAELLQAAQQRGYRWVSLDLAGYRMGGAVRSN